MRFIYLDDAAAARVRNGNPLDGRAVELFERRSVDPAAELCACTAGVRPKLRAAAKWRGRGPCGRQPHRGIIRVSER